MPGDWSLVILVLVGSDGGLAAADEGAAAAEVQVPADDGAADLGAASLAEKRV